MSKISKLLYVIARELSIFSLPGFRGLRNKIYSSHLIAPGINVDKNVRIQPLHSPKNTEKKIGHSLHIGNNCLIDLSGTITIGSRVTISEGAKIFTHTHPIDDGNQDWRKNPIKYSSLCIGDDVWIGANAIILSSVEKIGDGAIIAAGSIVSKNVEKNTVVGGTPAKPLRLRKLNE